MKKVAPNYDVISNESSEVNARRIRTFRLDRLVDAFISSCFVGMRKLDVEIFRLALDLAQTAPAHAVLIDNTPMFAQIAERLGMRSILHVDYESTRAKLTSLGLQTSDVTWPCRQLEKEIEKCRRTYSPPRNCSTKRPM